MTLWVILRRACRRSRLLEQNIKAKETDNDP